MDLLSLIFEAIKDAPGIVDSIKASLVAKGYSNEQIDLIFAPVVPREQLGIDPNHPFAPDASEPAATAQQPAAAPAVTLATAHISARTPEQAAALNPGGTTAPAGNFEPVHISARTPEQAAALKAAEKAISL